jgi:uncharacterized membrane protein
LAAALVVGCSAFFIYYTHELRAYVPSVLCTSFTLWAYWRILNAKNTPSKLLQLGLVLGGAAALYTHYLSALVLVSLALYHLLIVPKNQRWWRLTLLGLVSGALFCPGQDRCSLRRRGQRIWFRSRCRFRKCWTAWPMLSATGA